MRWRGEHSRGGRARRCAAALVEMALILVLLSMLVFGILDLGRASMSYLAMNEAAALAVEYGTKVDNSRVGSNYPADARVVDLARSALGPIVDASMASFAVSSSTVAGMPARQVTIRYSLPLVSPFLGTAFPSGMVSLTAQAVHLYPE